MYERFWLSVFLLTPVSLFFWYLMFKAILKLASNI